VCCSVLQCVAVCCSVLQCVAVCYFRKLPVAVSVTPLYWAAVVYRVSEFSDNVVVQYIMILTSFKATHLLLLLLLLLLFGMADLSEDRGFCKCVAVCCSVLQCVCSALQGDLIDDRASASVLQCVAMCCSLSQRVAACCSVSQCVAVCCSALHAQCTAGSAGRNSQKLSRH